MFGCQEVIEKAIKHKGEVIIRLVKK